MKAIVLASGSKGNCTIISYKNTNLIIDLGLSYTSLKRDLEKYGIEKIDAVLITHTHVDHIGGLKVFDKNQKVPIYFTSGMIKQIDYEIKNKKIIDKDQLVIGDIKIGIIKLSHDTKEILGFIIKTDKEIIYITDTGYINRKYYDKLKNKDIYIFESNHDIEMLLNGKYPHHIKQRILGDEGHLSNKDSSYYLSKLAGNKTTHIVLAHLSEDNNTEDLALNTLKEHLIKENKIIDNIMCAKQREEVVISGD